MSFLRALGAAWAGCLPELSGGDALHVDDEVADWLRALFEASAVEAGVAVANAGPERTTAAARWLLGYSRSRLLAADGPFDWADIDQLGKLLLRIVERGHGRDFSGGQLAATHARMLIGLGSRFHSPAEDSFRQAERDYLSDGAPVFAALARAATMAAEQARVTITATPTGGLPDFTALDSATAQVRATGGIDLEADVDAFSRTLRCITAMRAAVDEPDCQATMFAADAEAPDLFKTAALTNLDKLEIGLRLARRADEINRLQGAPVGVVAAIGQALAARRRFGDAVVVLEECHDQDPADRDVTDTLVSVYQELGRLDAERALLISTLSDPPGVQDVWALQALQNLAYMRKDPEYRRWQELLAQLDPARTLSGQVPGTPAPPPREPLQAAFRDGNLLIGPGFMDLPEQDRTAHMTAAIIAGSPNGAEQFSDLVRSDPALAERVASLLGLRKVTADESKSERHIQVGEKHFSRGDFEAAAAEYEAALEINPDNAVALNFLGDTWYRRGGYNTAQAYFEESIAVDPTPQAYRFLGDAIMHTAGSRRQVRLCYQQALRLDPGYGGAQVALQQLDKTEKRPSWLGGRTEALGGDQGAGDTTSPPDVPGTSSAPAALRWSPIRASSWRSQLSGPPERALQSTDQAVTAGDRREPEGSPESARRSGPAEPPRPAQAARPAPPSGSSPDGEGGRLERAVLEQYGANSIAAVIDDDDAFSRWIAAATPDAISSAIMIAVTVAYQYEVKDRNLARWAHWVQREVQLAEALPADYGPGQSADGIGRDRRLGEAYQAWGAVLRTQGRLAEARDWYERAIELLDAEREARVRAGLLGETEYDQVFSSVDPYAVTLEQLASICHELGDDDAANRYAILARKQQRGRPTDESQVDELVESGDYFIRNGDFEAALSCFHQAYEGAEVVAATAVVPRALVKVLNALGRCHRRLRLYRSALAYFDRARELNEETHNAVRLTWDYREIGRVYRHRPDLGDARQALEASLLNASHPGDPGGLFSWVARDGRCYQITAADRAWETLLELGDLLEDRNDLADAASFLELATSLADEVWASAADDTQRVAVAIQRMAAFTGLTRLALRRARTQPPDPAAAADAWRASEAMRARSFLDALGDDELAVPPGLPPDLVAHEADALERRRRLLTFHGHDTVFWSDLGRVHDELQDLWTRMLAATPAAEQYVDLRRGRPASAADIQRTIAGDGRPTVIASVVPCGSDQLAVIAVRSDDARPVVVSQPANLDRLNRFIEGNLGTAGRVRELATDLEDLFHHVMEPLTNALGEVSREREVLIVSPFGVLNYVPLTALRVGGVPLAERNPLAVVPNASLIRALRSAAGSLPRLPAAVFGDPTGDLPGARNEAQQVAVLLGTEPVCGAAVTRDAVTDALRSAGTVHIAAHAHFDAANPLSSGLRLADGLLTARDLLAQSFPGLSLVTLSACETGISQENPAQELLGLTRALLFGGADSLLVSLWKVADSATVEVMSAFYTRLLQHGWKADALQEAALTARGHYGQQRFDRWAGFELIGEWR